MSIRRRKRPSSPAADAKLKRVRPSPSKLTQLPYDVIAIIFVLSSNPDLPLVCSSLFHQLYHCAFSTRIAWLLHRHNQDPVQALEGALHFRFFRRLGPKLLNHFDRLQGITIRLDNKMMPPFLLAQPDSDPLILELLQRGASPHKPQGYPLIKAAQLGLIERVKTLITYGADPVARNNMALRVAAARSHREMLMYLLDDLGVKPDSETLKVCVTKGLWDMVKILVDYGAVPDMSTLNFT